MKSLNEKKKNIYIYIYIYIYILYIYIYIYIIRYSEVHNFINVDIQWYLSFIGSWYLKLVLRVRFILFDQIVKGYFWDLKCVWEGRRNLWGAGRNIRAFIIKGQVQEEISVHLL